MCRILRKIFLCVAALGVGPLAHAAPDHVDITWMSITNMHFALGRQQILADGYITRLPQEVFFGGANGFDSTRRPMKSDLAAVTEVFDAIGGKSAVNLLLTGHSHFDHSFDTANWARLSGARIIGSPTTCLQVRAAKIPARRCTPVFGGEKFTLEPGVEMYVIRWNHSGDPAKNGAQHNPAELRDPPKPDSKGGLRAGVAEDFPNGGGNRAYLFKVDGPKGQFSWLFQDSASAVDLRVPIVIDGRNFGAPLDNLRAAMQAAKLESVDLWIATGGRDIAELVLPVLKPKAYLPVHWDGLFGAFKAGPPQRYADAELETLLAQTGVRPIIPVQYMDRWRLDTNGVQTLDNLEIKQKLGFH
jgi:L-ascorbate metabolism protein UlaG (beta-lactamase superfamily)